MPVSTYGAGYMAELIATQDMYLAMLLSYPADTDSGSELNEPTAVDYARAYLDPANWSTAIGGVCTYDAPVSYSPAADWGEVIAYALCSASTDGEVFFYEYLTPMMNIKTGSTVVVGSGMLALEVG